MSKSPSPGRSRPGSTFRAVVRGAFALLAAACSSGQSSVASGTNKIHASAAALMPRSTHTLMALMGDNMHVPLMPLVAVRVTVRIGK